MADSVYDLISIQHGKQAAFGTSVPATFKWPGNGTLEFEDATVVPERMTGEPGGLTVEDGFVGATGTMFNLNDTELSAELMVYLGNMACKAIATGTGAGPYTWAFTWPTTTAPNSINFFTFEFATDAQEYEAADCFCESFNIHGDTLANEGRALVNAKIVGRKATPSTLTPALGLYIGHTPLNVNNGTYAIDPLGAVAYGATTVAGALRGFALDVTKTGYERGPFMDGRADLDYAVALGGGLAYRMSGNLKLLFGSHAVTQVANWRAGTGKLLALKIGSGSRIVQLNVPIFLTKQAAIGGTNEQGMLLAEFPFTVGHSRTTTVHGPEIQVTAAAQITMS